MSIETEIASLTTAIRNLTDVLLASAAKTIPAPTPSVAISDVTTTITEAPVPAPAPKKVVKKEPAPAPAPEPTPEPAPVPEAPAPKPVSEEELRAQIVDLARPKMGNPEFKAFFVAKLAELQGAQCSVTGGRGLPAIGAEHLPTLLAAVKEKC